MLQNDRFQLEGHIGSGTVDQPTLSPVKNPTVSKTVLKNRSTSPPNPSIAEVFQKSINTYYTFSTSSRIIDYGQIVPGEPILRSMTFTPHAPLSHGYTVYLYQDQPLTAEDSTHIPSTTCDDGTCTALHASKWESPLTFGNGYRCDSSGSIKCHADFNNTAMFKQLPTATASATPLFKTFNTAKQDAGRITLKINVPGTQPVKPYTNSFTFLLIPNL